MPEVERLVDVCGLLHMRLPDVLGLPLTEVQIYLNYLDKYPAGWRQEVATGLNTAVMANLNRDVKKTPRPYKASDFSSVAARLTPQRTELQKSKALYAWMCAHAKSDRSTPDAEADEDGAAED